MGREVSPNLSKGVEDDDLGSVLRWRRERTGRGQRGGGLTVRGAAVTDPPFGPPVTLDHPRSRYKFGDPNIILGRGGQLGACQGRSGIARR